MTTSASQPEQVSWARYPMDYYGRVWRYSNGMCFWEILLWKGEPPFPQLGGGWAATSSEARETMQDTMQLWVMHGTPHTDTESVKEQPRGPAGFPTPGPAPRE